MKTYTPGTQIKVKIPCTHCTDGFVELPNNPGSALKLYHRGYCPKCSGEQWIEKWISIETLSRWLTNAIDINSNNMEHENEYRCFK